MKAAINASPIIFLSKIDRIQILNGLFDRVFMPKAVLEEVSVHKSEGRESRLDKISYEVLEVNNRTAVLGMLGRLHIGEVEVMIGAIEQGIRTVILDDGYARNKAKLLGLEVTGTLGLLLRAFFDMAELKAETHEPMYMRNWLETLDKFSRDFGVGVLENAGSVSHIEAVEKAYRE